MEKIIEGKSKNNQNRKLDSENNKLEMTIQRSYRLIEILQNSSYRFTMTVDLLYLLQLFCDLHSNLCYFNGICAKQTYRRLFSCAPFIIDYFR